VGFFFQNIIKQELAATSVCNIKKLKNKSFTKYIGCKSANAKIENWYGMGFLVITFELRTVRISFKSNKS
jgi:hypothetical protein